LAAVAISAAAATLVVAEISAAAIVSALERSDPRPLAGLMKEFC
jgi:hypothetical protein